MLLLQYSEKFFKAEVIEKLAKIINVTRNVEWISNIMYRER